MRSLIVIAALCLVSCASALHPMQKMAPSRSAGRGSSEEFITKAVAHNLVDAFDKMDLSKLTSLFATDATAVSPGLLGSSEDVPISTFLATVGAIWKEVEKPHKWVGNLDTGSYSVDTFAVELKGLGFVNRTASGYPKDAYAYLRQGFAVGKINTAGQIYHYGFFANDNVQANRTTVINKTVEAYVQFAKGSVSGFMSHFSQYLQGFTHDATYTGNFNYTTLQQGVTEDFSIYQTPIITAVDDNVVVSGKFALYQVQFFFKTVNAPVSGYPTNILVNAYHLFYVDENYKIVFADFFETSWTN